MIQKKYLCKDIAAIEETISPISDILSTTPHKSAVLTIYQTGFSKNDIDAVLKKFRDCGFPELQFAGLSITVVAELMADGPGTGALLNLILTDEAGIEVVPVPCLPGEEREAAGKLNEKISALDHVRAVELFGNNAEFNTTLFMETAMAGHEDAALFGTSTMRNIQKKITVDENEAIVALKQDDSNLTTEFVIGGDVLFDGYVAVIFYGEKLKCQANYALGWKPIGRKLSLELGENPAKGETVITKINDMPAVDIYREYLGVYPDSFLISNICEFPFIVERDGINICMIPLEGGKDGELYFMATLRPGEQVRFSFASHDEVLYAYRESLETMEAFRPEALFLTLCGNRISFLKEDAYLEWHGFEDVAPEFALMHGAGELFYYQGRGGILNSAHLAIGLREAESVSDGKVYQHPSVESFRHDRPLSLSDRMSTFLEKITSELIDTAQQAKDANSAKSAFLSHMSHEIRTPINAILGMDEMILKESKDPTILDYADSIRSSGDNLLGIINDILDFSKIEAGKMSIIPTEFEMITAIKNMYNVVRLRAEGKGLKIVLDIDPALPSVLYGDVIRINQVVTNLLTNAIKYTEKGTVTFSVKKIADGTPADEEAFNKACPDEQRPKKSVRIRTAVKDTGIGIKPEDMEKLFDEFERFDEKRNVKIEGTGLGLSITKEFLDLMGCRLSVESTYGEGSEFSFEIMQGVIDDTPFGDIEAQLNKQPVNQKKRIKFTAEDARILVVDDTPINLLVMTKLLKNTKIKVDGVKSGEDALRLVQERSYDVIFLDHKMPNMDGPETLRRMRELENNVSADAPVISLTANALTNAKEEYLRAGYKDYLSKPIRPEELEDMLFYYIPAEKIRTVPIDA